MIGFDDYRGLLCHEHPELPELVLERDEWLILHQMS